MAISAKADFCSLLTVAAVRTAAVSRAADARAASSSAMAGRHTVRSLSALYSIGSVMRVYLKYLRLRCRSLNPFVRHDTRGCASCHPLITTSHKQCAGKDTQAAARHGSAKQGEPLCQPGTGCSGRADHRSNSHDGGTHQERHVARAHCCTSSHDHVNLSAALHHTSTAFVESWHRQLFLLQKRAHQSKKSCSASWYGNCSSGFAEASCIM